MSAIRNPATITSVGRRMMTAGGDITYTKAVLYGQDISHLTREQLESLTSIGNPLVTVPLGISDKNDNGNGTTVILEATFQNSNLKADLPYTAVGFFAKRGDDAEKLIAVGVATDGAYLAATSPDGVATDALDIKVAIAIGDSANVTAMIDPAGSVTPAALHNVITDVKSEMKTGLDTKADKQTVTDDLATKADKTDVDAQIGTVNKSVSDLSDTVKANKDDTDKVLATKADKATVESELSTKANQSDLDKTNAEVAKKASTTDVNSQLATKADAKDVTDALALKDDTVDVDKKISNVTNSVNSLSSTVTSNKSATDTALGTKANANDVANSFEEVRNRVKKLEGQQELTAPDFNTLTSTGIYMIENPTNGKNSPSNGNWGTLVVSRGTTGSDSRILQEYYPDSGDLPYFRMSGSGGVWRDWKQLSDQSEINSLRDAVNTKADKTALDAYAKSADVANDVKTLQDNINAKADAQTVSDAISKIDLTPFAKTADVNSALSGKADKVTIDAINKALASKRDITDSYSRDELDKKFLQLSADTGGKVSADQVSKLIAGKADQDDVDKKIKAVTDAVNTKADKTDVTAQFATKADKSSLDETNAEVAKKADSEDVTKQLATKANVSDVDDALSKKDDTADVDQKIATVNKSVSDLSDTVSANKTATDASLATKANASDVADNVKTLQANIDTKADKATVDTEIAKIDFTPYAKSADVAKDLQGYTTTADLTKLLAGKRDIADSYSRDELDKKFLQLSTDTSGKVSADQIAKLLASKVDKTDLTSQLQAITDSIGTKANSANVTAELAKKDDTSDVDAKIKTVTDLANTKANSVDVTAALDKKDDTSDVDAKIKVVTDLTNTKANANDVYNRSTVDNAFTEVRGRLSKLEGTQTLDSPDFNGITASGIYYITNNNGANIKNNPVGQWGVLIVSNGNGHRVSQVYYPDDGNPPWYRSLDESTWRSWYQLSTKTDVNNAVSLANKAQDTANQANTNISKIDLSPYAKSADVNSELANKASTTDVANANNNANGRLPLGGGNMTLRSTINWNGGGIDDKTGNLGGLNWAGGTDWAKIYGDQDDNDNLDLAFDLGDDGSNHFSFRQNGSETSAITSDGHYTGTVDWGHVNGRPQDQVDRVNIITPLFRQIQNSNNWNDIFGVGNPNNVLTSLRIDSGGSGALLNDFAAGIGFGGADTKGVLSVAYQDHQARITGGNGSGPVWSEDIAWKTDVNDLQNQIQQLKDNQFEVQTFTDATAAANWEAQKPGHRLAIVNK